MSEQSILTHPLALAINSDPTDDGVRLVLADWLDEHGEPMRAAFYRWTVRERKVPAQAFRCVFWYCEGQDSDSSVSRPQNCLPLNYRMPAWEKRDGTINFKWRPWYDDHKTHFDAFQAAALEFEKPEYASLRAHLLDQTHAPTSRARRRRS